MSKADARERAFMGSLAERLDAIKKLAIDHFGHSNAVIGLVVHGNSNGDSAIVLTNTTPAALMTMIGQTTGPGAERFSSPHGTGKAIPIDDGGTMQ